MIARFVDALAAAAATVAAILGLTTLTENASWVGRSAWCCLAVAAAGLLLRWLTSIKVLVMLGQVVLTASILVAMFAADRLRYALPGPEVWQRVAELVNEGMEVMQRYVAPVPTSDGVEFDLVAAVAGLAVLVDFLAVTERMPGSRDCRCSPPSSPRRPSAAPRSRRGISSSARGCGWFS